MGRGDIFQMDEAASENQILLGNDHECCKDPNLLRDHRLLPCWHRPKQVES